MLIRFFWAVLMASLIPWGGGAWAAPKVIVRSELAAPVILENLQERNYLKVSLRGFPLEARKRSPINLSLVIDRSSSMSAEQRIEKARDAAVMAVNMLNEEDTLSIVTYDSQVEVIVPPTRVKNKEMFIRKIHQNIAPRGMTALFGGVSKGITLVDQNINREKVNRVLLLSDGQANVGPSSVSELSELAKAAAKKGISITTIGLGRDYNEDLMAAIASYSDGNHVFVQRSSDLEQVFAREFNDVMSVVAQDVEVVIQLSQHVRPIRLLGRDGEIRGNTVVVRLNQIYSKQEKYVLLEVMPEKGRRTEEKSLAEVSVRYDNLGSREKDDIKQSVRVRYTDSVAEVKKSIVEEVMVDSELQKITLENERALKLMDEGRVSEAKEVVRKNKQLLESMPVAVPAAMEKRAQGMKMNSTLEETMAKEDATVSRKVMKEQIHDVKNQKSAP